VLRKANTNNQSRTKTLLPIIRNIIIAVFAALFGLVLLSELGINVTPLLAGAGVIGVAVGFGAQSFVKDFLSGFTIILEDIVRVGDVVNLGGASGSVEKITLRKIQLRDFAGTVYTIPYSEIKTIQNLTKDFSYYVMDIGVPYTQNIDRVIAALRAVDEEMRKDDSFSFMILEPLEIAGVDKFAEGAVVIKARIKTQPIRQWTVGREFNKRMKIEFEKDGIEMPLAQRTVNVRSLDAKAPTAEALLEAAAAADRSQS
jgi:small conductance mechanosensitive channel